MDMGMLSLIGILLALVLLVLGSFKGMPIMILGPVCAAIVFLFSGLPIIENMKGAYAADFGGFAKPFPAKSRRRAGQKIPREVVVRPEKTCHNETVPVF